MAPAFSKLPTLLCDPIGIELILDGMKYKDELQTVLVQIEKTDDPGEYESVTELFCMYVEQQSCELAGKPLWLCTFSFNNAAGTSWPEIKFPETSM